MLKRIHNGKVFFKGNEVIFQTHCVGLVVKVDSIPDNGVSIVSMSTGSRKSGKVRKEMVDLGVLVLRDVPNLPGIT